MIIGDLGKNAGGGSTTTSLEQIQTHLAADASSNPATYSLRYLLARRLAREGRDTEAREYFPAPLLPKFDELVAARKSGMSQAKPKADRANALWRAAKITRWLGMELLGSELEPDWHVYDGQLAYYMDQYREARLGRPQPISNDGEGVQPNAADLRSFIPAVSKDEQRRVDKEQIQPDKRFHYRYQAADLAWQAAALMPDQQDATARVLAAGGLWLESVDETKAADRYYVALLRRCGRTELGRQAEKSGKLPEVPHEDP